MKSFELQPTEENIWETYDKDMLGRNADIFAFILLLDSVDTSFSIALDAQWGDGKTFFVKQTKMVLDAFNDFTESPYSDKRGLIRAVWNKTGTCKLTQQAVSVYYDAWENDNDDDPILSLVYSIMLSINTDYTLKGTPNYLELAKSIIKLVTGKNVDGIVAAFEHNDPLEELRKQKGLKKQIEEFLSSLLPEHGNRLVIFVDELDRCRPLYAVKMLERIKHYFSNEKITFVFSVNMSELQHTIKRCYGESFDACRYLDRFFDYKVPLPPANMAAFYQYIGLEDHTYFDRMCRAVAEKYHLSLRELSKYYRILRTSVYKEIVEKGPACFGEEKERSFCLTCIAPIMVVLMVQNQGRYKNFINGMDRSPIHEIEFPERMCEWLLNSGESFDNDKPADNIQVVKLDDRIDDVYNAVFVASDTERTEGISVGQLWFSKKIRNQLLRLISSLSNSADYTL